MNEFKKKIEWIFEFVWGNSVRAENGRIYWEYLYFHKNIRASRELLKLQCTTTGPINFVIHSFVSWYSINMRGEEVNLAKCHIPYMHSNWNYLIS